MLIFNYATMGAGKSALLIAKATSNKNSIVLKPALDTREQGKVWSRNGQWIPCDLNITDEVSIVGFLKKAQKEKPIKFIYVDESQFLTHEQIEELMKIGYEYNIIVECFGLLVNFQSELFEGSKRLVELADQLVSIPAFDSKGEIAKQNARLVDGVIIKDGPEIMVGKEETYRAMSNKEYFGGLE